MGREIRRVPKDWEHPKREDGDYIPLEKGPFSKVLSDWREDRDQWEKGLRRRWGFGDNPDTWIPIEGDMEFDDWVGGLPSPEEYMPEFAPGAATHLMMYEDCSEGTPISPAFATSEELARWLADNNASSFGSMTASYDQWLATIKVGSAISAVFDSKGFRSGVELNGDNK